MVESSGGLAGGSDRRARESEKERRRGRGKPGGGDSSVGRAGRGMDGCKSGEISKPGWELSSSGQHHGWRVELECLPTPHAAPNPTAILPP